MTVEEEAAELLPDTGPPIDWTEYRARCLPGVAERLRELRQFIAFTEQNRDEWARRAEERLVSLNERGERIAALEKQLEDSHARLVALEAENARLLSALRNEHDGSETDCPVCEFVRAALAGRKS